MKGKEVGTLVPMNSHSPRLKMKILIEINHKQKSIMKGYYVTFFIFKQKVKIWLVKGDILIDIEKCKDELCAVACPQESLELSRKINSKGYHYIVK